METESPAKTKATQSTSQGVGGLRNVGRNSGKRKGDTEYLSGDGPATECERKHRGRQGRNRISLGGGGGGVSGPRSNILLNLSSPQNMALLKKQAHKQEHKKYRAVITIIQRLEGCRNTDLYPVMDNDPGASP